MAAISNNISNDSTTPNRRSLAQRARQERERIQRTAANSSSNRHPAPPTPPPSARIVPPQSMYTLQKSHPPAYFSLLLGQRSNPQPRRRTRLTRMIHDAANLFMIARRPYVDPPERHDLGPMNVECPYCRALHWNAERTAESMKSATPAFGTCCNHGKVRLPPPRNPPDVLRNLLHASDAQCVQFRTNIRAYNMALAFTSLGVASGPDVNRGFGGGAWVFRIQGQLSHLSGALRPDNGTAPSYAQLYTYDPETALRQRMHRNSTLDNDTMSALQSMLIQHHQYAPIFKHAWEILEEMGEVTDAEIRLRVQPSAGEHRGRHNLPTANEVAMIIPDGSTSDYRDIVLRRHMPDGQTKLYRINEGHPAYLPLHYVLLFPYGENGWHRDMQQIPDPTLAKPLASQ